MGFEDDLFEYGFNDGHDYIDYLMDKADQKIKMHVLIAHFLNLIIIETSINIRK